MAKFTGKAQVLTFNSITFGTGGSCITSTEYSDAADVYLAECAGATSKEHITGLREITATVSGYVNATDVAMLNAIQPGVSDTDWDHDLAGPTATYITVTSTNATVLNRSISDPVAGLCTFTFTVGLDTMTIAAIGA